MARPKLRGGIYAWGRREREGGRAGEGGGVGGVEEATQRAFDGGFAPTSIALFFHDQKATATRGFHSTVWHFRQVVGRPRGRGNRRAQIMMERPGRAGTSGTTHEDDPPCLAFFQAYLSRGGVSAETTGVSFGLEGFRVGSAVIFAGAWGEGRCVFSREGFHVGSAVFFAGGGGRFGFNCGGFSRRGFPCGLDPRFAREWAPPWFLPWEFQLRRFQPRGFPCGSDGIFLAGVGTLRFLPVVSAPAVPAEGSFRVDLTTFSEREWETLCFSLVVLSPAVSVEVSMWVRPYFSAGMGGRCGGRGGGKGRT